MYAEIILREHLNFVDDLELPRPVTDEESGCQKTTFSKLEVSKQIWLLVFLLAWMKGTRLASSPGYLILLTLQQKRLRGGAWDTKSHA